MTKNMPEIGSLLAIYRDLHEHPELSGKESRTAAIVAREYRAAGFEVTEQVGGYGVVGVLRNGDGPVVAIRADMDALPLEEATGLDFASTVRAQGADGHVVPVAHACGHDLHTTNLIGVARRLSVARARWRGTVLLYGQPAEEIGGGARAMLADGLYTRFPKPEYLLALHVVGAGPAGFIGYSRHRVMAAAASIDIRIHGSGGHGGVPEATRDPVLLGSQIVVGLQSIVSREVAAADEAVITVGSFQAGEKGNIIPETALLKLTVRAGDDALLDRLIERIRGMTSGLATGFGFSQLPEVTVLPERTPVLSNDTALADRIVAEWRKTRSPQAVNEMGAITASEDFGEFSRSADSKIPSFYFFIGAAKMEDFLAAMAGKRPPLPNVHNPAFAPDAAPTLAAGLDALTEAALKLLAAAPPAS